MDFSEYKRLLGADPRADDPALLRARDASPEYETEYREAQRFEDKLERALSLPEPDGLLDDLARISEQPPARLRNRNLPRLALAASLFIAVGAAGIFWTMNNRWESVEEYLVDHYRHDGPYLLTQVESSPPEDVQAVLSELGVQAGPRLSGIVGLIKYCPTPDGKGVHMILNTDTGPVTVFYMPDTNITDPVKLAFDDVEAMTVGLQSGSAVIIGPDTTRFGNLQALLYDSLVPMPDNS